MKRMILALSFSVTAAVTCTGQVAQTTPEAIEAAWAFLPQYEFGQDRLPLTSLDYAIKDFQGDPAKLAEYEKRFIAILEDPDATLEGKRWLLRHLAVMGTAASVPATAAAIGIEGLTDYAIRALEANPAPEAGGALREALATVDDKTAIIG